MKSGIYMIINKENNKIYIGSSMNIGTRLRNHKNSLKRGDHENHHLQRAWDKYGENCFLFIPVKYLSRKWLAEYELYYINKYSATKFSNGYNIISKPYLKPKVIECTKKILSDRFSGENSSSVILNWENVNEIRNRYSNSETITWKDLASEFDVSISCVQSLIQHKTWKDQNYVYKPRSNEVNHRRLSKMFGGENSPSSKINWDIVIQLRQSFKIGLKVSDIARKFNLNRKTVDDVIKYKTWRNKK